MPRYQVSGPDWRKFDREFAVVDMLTRDRNGELGEWVLQTNSRQRAEEFAEELNSERA